MMLLPESHQELSHRSGLSRRSFASISRAARDKGAASIEQVGIITVVALLVAAGTLGVANYGPHLSNKLCELSSGMGITAGPCAPPVAEQSAPVGELNGPELPTNADYLPPVCSLKESESTSEYGLKLGFFAIEDTSGFIVTEYADGTVTAAAADGGYLGLEAGEGIKWGSDGVAIGVDVDYGAGIEFEQGSTWTFDSLAEWEEMETDLNAYLLQQDELQNAGMGAGGLHVWYWWSDGYLDPPKEPNVQTSMTQLKVYADAIAGLRAESGKTSSGDPEWYDPNMGLYAKGELGEAVIRTEDSKTQEVSETFTFIAEGDAGLNFGIANAGRGGEYERAYKITRDKNDEIIALEFMRETEGKWTGEIEADPELLNLNGPGSGTVQIGATKNDQRTIETTTLEVNSANRQVVDDWVDGNNDAMGSDGPLLYPANAFSPSDSIHGDDLADLLYRESKSSLQVYDNVEEGQSFAFEFAHVAKFGASFENKETETTLNSAHFLGAPQTDGKRGYVPDDACE